MSQFEDNEKAPLTPPPTPMTDKTDTTDFTKPTPTKLTETADKAQLTYETDPSDPTNPAVIYTKKTDMTPTQLSDITKTYVLEEKTTPTTKASDVEMKELDQEALERYKPALEKCLAMAPPPPPGGGRTMILKPLDVVPMEDGGKKIVVTDDPVKAVRPGTPVEKKD